MKMDLYFIYVYNNISIFILYIQRSIYLDIIRKDINGGGGRDSEEASASNQMI